MEVSPGSSSKVFPRFSQPGPGSSQAAPSQVPAAPRQLPGSSQPDPGSSRQLPGRSRQLPEGLPGSSLTVSHSARLSQTSLPGRFSRRSWAPRRSCKHPGVPRQLSGNSWQLPGSSRQLSDESHIKNGHHESHIKHDHPLACDLWDCSNLVFLSSCIAMSFLSKRFIQTFPPGVTVDVSFLLLHLFRALHEGTLVSTW